MSQVETPIRSGKRVLQDSPVLDIRIYEKRGVPDVQCRPAVIPDYQIASQQVRTVDGVTYTLIETPVMGTRQHRRMIGADPLQVSLFGRPLLYSDTYPSAPNEPTYVYCGHRADPITFLQVLDIFLIEQASSFPEFRNRDFKLVMSRGGQLEEVEIRIPFSASLALANVAISEPISFMRFYIPFGDVAISFAKIYSSEQELACVRTGHLQAKLESPLIGCDMTKSDILVILMARLHWASGMLSESTLEHLIGQLSFNPVAA